jgi:hypothetical protein
MRSIMSSDKKLRTIDIDRRKDKIPSLIVSPCEGIEQPHTKLKLDNLKLSTLNLIEDNKSHRKSQTLDDFQFSNRLAFNRSILNINGSRNPSIFEFDNPSPARKNTVQFGENSFLQSNRNSIITKTHRLSFSQQRQSYAKKVRHSVTRKDSVFYIHDEDKIFDDEKFKTSVEWVRSLMKEKKPLKLNNTESNFRYIYKSNHESVKRIKKAQRMKNLDLDRYQKGLVLSIGSFLSKDAIRKLETNLQNVKKMANKVKREETIECLFSEISEQNEVTIRNLKESVDKLNHIREVVKLGGERLPKIKYKKI